jgi:ribonuclease R
VPRHQATEPGSDRPEQATPEPLVCEVSRRGKLLVGEPFFEPRTPVVLDRKTATDAALGDLVVVIAPRRGRARIARVLGPTSAIENVLDGLLHHTGVRRPGGLHGRIAGEVEALPAGPDGVEPGRVDLRDSLTFTVDPDTAKDYDDAITIRRDGDGVRAWVHIADVARYVGPGSAIDSDAAERALSVYVPGTVEPMLPERLSSDVCSLVPGQDRNAVTVEVPFSADLVPGEAAFYRSVIRSRFRLTYTQVESILAGREQTGADLGDALRLAETVASELRRRRLRRGALEIETGELAFVFDGHGGIEQARFEAEPLAHSLVEELMILANEAVARLLAGRRREALYRVHDRPDPQAIELLLAKLDALDVPAPPVPDALTSGTAARLAATVSAAVRRYVSQARRGEEAFPALVLRALKQARYDPRNLGHSGLASTAYCHFTSPIRRYPDLICHRALLSELGAAADPLPEDLEDAAAWCSVREREGAHVEHAADRICLAWLLERRLFETGWEVSFDGEVTGAIGSGLFVRFGEVFEGYVPARRLPGDYYELDPLGVALVGRRTGRRYRLGDAIEVAVDRVDRVQGKVDLVPV